VIQWYTIKYLYFIQLLDSLYYNVDKINKETIFKLKRYSEENDTNLE